MGGVRPFGAALLIGGVSNGEPRLFETDPSGTPNEWKAVAIGADRSEIQDYLEEHWEPDLTLEAGIELALGALATTREEALEAEELAMGAVEAETAIYSRLGESEINAHLEDLDLEEDEE
jgi:proteasome alpha subunit